MSDELPKYLSVPEALAMLPFPVSECRFRQAVRLSGRYIANGHQIALTEADLAAVLETFRPSDTTSPRSSLSTGRAVLSAEACVRKARAEIAARLQKR